MPRADRFRTIVTARFESNAERIAGDMMKEAMSAFAQDDVQITQELIDLELEHAQYRLELAADSASWQGFQIGRLDVIEQGEMSINWVLEPGAEHCPTCLAYAAGSPYTAATLPGIPAQANTECNGSCRCNLEPVAA
ncbi:MAG: hypothetical protein AB1752_11615 [Candidatus Zixiibacteriota bacterium]